MNSNVKGFEIDLDVFRSKLVQCGGICGAKEDCEAYSVESSHCYLASASGLVGVSSDSSFAKTVYLNTKIKPGDKVYTIFIIKSTLQCPYYIIQREW